MMSIHCWSNFIWIELLLILIVYLLNFALARKEILVICGFQFAITSYIIQRWFRRRELVRNILIYNNYGKLCKINIRIYTCLFNRALLKLVLRTQKRNYQCPVSKRFVIMILPQFVGLISEMY